MKKIPRILLIDDDEINNYINKKLLLKLVIAEEIIILNNGKEAIDYVKDKCINNDKICPGLIILDHHMPVMDGVDFMIAFNKLILFNRNEIVFILLGTNSSQEDIAAFKRLGVEEFTEKPLAEKVVMDAYHKYWDNKE